MKKEIKPIYSELQGYLSQIPDKSTSSSQELWNQPNKAIDELISVSGKDYSRFKTCPLRGELGEYINVESIRANLGGLISKLYGEYFSDEQPPFSGMPNTIIHQTQNQNQSQSIDFILKIQEKIITELPKYIEGSNERNFLEKLKATLPILSNTMDILSSILNIGAEFGLGPTIILKLLGLQ